MIMKELPPALRVRRTRVSIVAAAIWNGLGMTKVVRVNDRARLRRRALPGLRIDSRPGLNVDRPGLPDRRLRSLPSPSKRTPRRCCADSSARAATAMRLVTAVVIAMAAGADGAGAGFAADAPTRKPVARYDAASRQLVRRSNKSSIISRAAAQISVNLTGTGQLVFLYCTETLTRRQARSAMSPRIVI
jgi:hypothetical protein